MRCSSLELVRPSFHWILMKDMDWYGIGGVLFAATALLLSIIILAASKRRNVEALDFFPALLSVSHSNRSAGGESTTRTLLKIVKALSQSLYSIDNCIFKRTFTRLINGRASLPLVRHFTPTIKTIKIIRTSETRTLLKNWQPYLQLVMTLITSDLLS